MFKNDREEKWDKYSLTYASEINAKNKTPWVQDFLQTSVLLTNISISTIINFIKAFKLKLTVFNEKTFERKLKKYKKNDVESLFRFFLFDYLMNLMDNPKNQILFLSYGLNYESFIQESLTILNANNDEKKFFRELIKKKDTVFHTVYLLEIFSLGKDAKNHGIVDGVELIKEELFNQLDVSLEKILNTHFKKD